MKPLVIKPQTKRLLEVISYLERSESARQIAVSIKKSPAFITELKKGRTNASNGVIQMFKVKYRVNDNWIFTGEGERFLNQDQKSQLDSSASLFKDSKDVIKEILMLNREVSLIKREYDMLSKEVKIAVNRLENVEQKVMKK